MRYVDIPWTETIIRAMGPYVEETSTDWGSVTIDQSFATGNNSIQLMFAEDDDGLPYVDFASTAGPWHSYWRRDSVDTMFVNPVDLINYLETFLVARTWEVMANHHARCPRMPREGARDAQWPSFDSIEWPDYLRQAMSNYYAETATTWASVEFHRSDARNHVQVTFDRADRTACVFFYGEWRGEFQGDYDFSNQRALIRFLRMYLVASSLSHIPRRFRDREFVARSEGGRTNLAAIETLELNGLPAPTPVYVMNAPEDIRRHIAAVTGTPALDTAYPEEPELFMPFRVHVQDTEGSRRAIYQYMDCVFGLAIQYTRVDGMDDHDWVVDYRLLRRFRTKKERLGWAEVTVAPEDCPIAIGEHLVLPDPRHHFQCGAFIGWCSNLLRLGDQYRTPDRRDEDQPLPGRPKRRVRF